MSKSLTGKKIALLIANGFNQADMTAAQKALIEHGANVRIVSPETGLVNGWDITTWGHNFAVDEPLSSALGADYDMVVVPSGERSINKLKLTAHSKRFLGSFFNAQKPIAMMGDAVALTAFTGHVAGRTVEGPDNVAETIMQASGVWNGRNEICVDGNLLTADVTDASRSVFMIAVVNHFTGEAESAENDMVSKAA